MHKRSLTILALSAFLLASCDVGGDHDPVKIGLITPLTGEVASIGADVLHGAEIMLEEINSAGGINGREIKLIAEDGRCAGADAAAAAQKLINVDQVVAIHGAGCSSESLAAYPIAEAAQVVIVSPSSSSPDLTHASDFFFRTYPSDDLKTTAMTQYFKENEFEKVAIISENTDFCEAFRASLKRKIGEDNFVFEIGSKLTNNGPGVLEDLEDVECFIEVPQNHYPFQIINKISNFNHDY